MAKIIKFIVKIFIGWLLFILLALLAGSFILKFYQLFPYVEIAQKYSKNLLVWSWANFDGVHYLSIAEKGYGGFEQAFFPLYPLLIRLLSPFFVSNYLFSGLFISHLSLLISLWFLYKLVCLDYDDKTAKWTIFFILSFPTSFFFGAVYTESLFLMLILMSFYGARTNKWWLAGIAGMLASITRLVGIFLFPVLLIEYYQQFKVKISKPKGFKMMSLKINLKLLFLLLIPIGLLSYMLYLSKTVGDPLYFIHSQPAFGANRSGGQLIFLPQVFWRYLKIFYFSQHNFPYFIAIFELVLFTFFSFLLIISFHKIKLSYWLFSALAIITPTLTGTLTSIPRYLVTIFPCFIFLALINNKKLKIFIIIVFLLALLLSTIFYTRGFFIS